MISFKNWLKTEGKAMDVSTDMDNFAKEVVEILNKRTWDFRQIIYQRFVESKYGKKEIKVKTMPQSNMGFMGDAVAKTGLIRIYLPSKKNPLHIGASLEIGSNGLPIIKSQGTPNIPREIPDYEKDFSDYYYAIIHELVHIFDAKLLSYPTWMKKYDGKTMEDYYIAPHEQDAWMAHRAREVLDHYLSYYNGNKEEVKKIISRLPHDTEPESIWHKYPRIWKKYLNTLYQVLQEK